jgi:hypothetical protein
LEGEKVECWDKLNQIDSVVQNQVLESSGSWSLISKKLRPSVLDPQLKT